MSAYFPTMGLEIHAELLTASKVFCTCSAEFGGEPNSRCCPVCSGLPGTLPVLNRRAVEYIVKAGYVMNCNISRFTKWDRKNYFYPDLPKAYQISQMPRPVCLDGHVDINVNGEEKSIRINRIHLEEDAGKLVHDDVNRVSLADYNRCGIPLIEIVTEPDFHTADEVIAFMEKVRLLLQYAGICDCKMEQGSIRCDVNISIAPKGSTELGTRTELKNLNSLKAIAKAIEVEIERQEELLDNGERVIQQTRRFNEALGETTAMRSKEDAHDYRYFPDPDIPPIIFTEEELEEIRASLPEMPEQRVKRYVEQYGIKKSDADLIVGDKKICDFFDEALAEYDNPKAIANYINGELMRRINLGEADMSCLKFTGREFAQLVELLQTDKLSQANTKAVLGEMLLNGGSPKAIADEKDLWIKEDNDLLAKVVDEIIANNPRPVEQYKNGDKKVFGFFMGQANKALKGAASPKAIQDYITKKLSEL
ncbi:MAG: Asp-tRNA(Asn)/Glu-tRNA(Gln) amidotransferase subunit GatB [Oscillospiraceae bacterium]|nr:Asp-tRNA(Asn)/Glu-tRNA(Gln) amidotransferase subunit GatB [Oscillospiraceae bacterium]